MRLDLPADSEPSWDFTPGRRRISARTHIKQRHPKESVVRIAVLIIGLILMVALFFQSLTINVLSDATNTENTETAGAVGLLMAVIWLVALGFVLPKPRISAVLFVVAAVIGAAGWSDFPDLQLWSGVSIVLAVLSYVGYRGKSKQEAKETARDATMQTLLANQAALAAPAGTVAAVQCPACGSMERPGARFCGSCGKAL